MKTGVTIARLIVGILFLLSGLIKANDPLGLAYKMQEFFEVWNAALPAGSLITRLLHALNDHTLGLSITMIGLEIMAGVAILIGSNRRFVLGTLLVLILFFTFLTGYAYGSGKFKDCGCFGNCLPITPLTSFVKDLVLLGLVLFLLWQHKYIQPVFARRKQAVVLVMALLLTAAIQWYALAFLPFVDCLPFKKNVNVSEQMKIPANAVRDSFAMKFIYERSGKRFEFSPESLPADLQNYTFIDRTQKRVRQGNAEPPIKGFSLVGLDGTDYTTSILSEPAAVLVFALHFETVPGWIGDFERMYLAARKQNIPVFVVSSEAAKGKIIFSSLTRDEVVFLSCDNTAVRTAARSNPTIYLLRKGNIINKQSAARVDYLMKDF